MNSFGKQLKALRKEIGVSQAYIADHLGISTQSVSNWECDNTMPDISQIVPLAALLSVSTDYLLGVGINENNDKAELEEKINQIWAAYSVNSPENNADYMAYELYKNYLTKYPMNYEVKYKCALAIYDYLYVFAIRKKFIIADQEFERLWSECERLLQTILDNCTLPEIQIDAENCLVDLMLLKGKWNKSEHIAQKLPNICGIRDKAFSRIAQSKGDTLEAYKRYERVCKQILFDYVNALFYRAKMLSEHPDSDKETVLMAWKYMEDESNNLLHLYLSVSDLTVNGYEKNPYCYLITSFTGRSNYLIRQGDIADALLCVEKAVDAAVDMFDWAERACVDKLIMQDILFFAQHTPGWCYRWAGEGIEDKIVCNDQFQKSAEKVRRLHL